MTGSLQCVVLDCADAGKLARFYQSLLGGTVNEPDDRWSVDEGFATVHTAAGMVLAFQRVARYRAPRWPDPAYPAQFHLDIEVPDIDAAHAEVTAHGATLLNGHGRGWRVYADPAGHPFCLLPRRR